MMEIKGTIAELIFYSDDSGYTVAILETEEEQITIVGYLPHCGVGRKYFLKGDYIFHPKYGDQFSFKKSEEVLPTTEEEIIQFLSSGFLKGVGEKAAISIVKTFGLETLDVMENEPQRLTEVNGIGKKRAADIEATFKDHRKLAKITVYLQQRGISTNYAPKLYELYGEDTIEAIEENPYRLATDLAGVGFIKADKIAENMGIEKENEERIKSGIKYFLVQFLNEGHTFIPRKELCEKSGELLDVQSDLVDEYLVGLAFDGSVQIDNLENRDVVYLMPYYLAEKNLTKAIAALNNGILKPIKAQVDSLINATEKKININFSHEQKEAIKSSLDNGVSVITGGPGTGKTTIINGIIEILNSSGLKIAIVAPTGRAAKRIEETTGHKASTVHRLLEYYFSEDRGNMVFGKTAENPLEYDAVIVDEVSMMDLMLTDGLLKAIKQGTRLILVGDADQLPSVGAGNILSDIVESEFIHATKLKNIFRQAEESLIVVNAHKINRGDYPDCNEKDKDFFLVKRNGEKEMVETILDLFSKRIPNYFDKCDPLKDIQILTPVKKGGVGTISLNKELQEKLNPKTSEVNEKLYGEKLFREGDKVMQVKNNYEIKWKKLGDFTEGAGVFNGDVGFIEKIDDEFSEMTVMYDDKFVVYNFTQLEELELAYSITVHKSQGNEFPVVIMPVSWFPPMLATRNLLYTAVTRGKTLVVLVGSENKMKSMVDNNRTASRYSGLKRRLGALIEF